jgi:hypothetical protein
MGDINNFVKVVIRLQTGGVTRVGFGTALILGEHTAFADRIKFYSDLSDMSDDGLDDSHGTNGGLVYNAAAAMFSQRPRPDRIAVGRVQVNGIKATVLNAVEGREYKATLDGTDYTYTAVTGDDADDIAAGIAALLNAVSGFTSAGVGTGGEYTLVLDTPGTFFQFAVDDNQTAAPAASGNEDFDDALVAVQDSSDDWYGLVITSRGGTVQEAVADAVEAMESPKFFRLASNDGDIINSTPADDTTSIARLLQLKALNRSSVIYHSKADGTMDDEFIDAAWTAMSLGFDPDVETATDKFKTLVGITPDDLSATQRANAIGTEESPTSGKNANVYTTVAGKNITQSGMTASGEWNDIIFGADWLKVRIEERIFNAFVRNPKLPYTNGGILAIVGEIRAQLQIGQRTQFLAFDEQWDKTFGFLLTYPDVSQVDSIDKANRILKGISFTATVAGAIHAAKPINGTLVP